jgi:hypothetical protein
MKTLKLVLLTALLTIGLASCGSGEGDNSCAIKTDTTSTTQQATTTTTTTETECSLQSATPDPVVGVTVRDNRVAILSTLDSYSIKTIRFEWDNGYSITSGQPWEGITIKSDGTYPVEMNVRAGRKGSSGPLNWFALHGGLENVISSEKWANIDSLNFAFSGVLIINGDRYSVVLGQEGFAGTNGWWIAGNGAGWLRHNPIFLTSYIVTPDNKWQILAGVDSIGFGIREN